MSVPVLPIQMSFCSVRMMAAIRLQGLYLSLGKVPPDDGSTFKRTNCRRSIPMGALGCSLRTFDPMVWHAGDMVTKLAKRHSCDLGPGLEGIKLVRSIGSRFQRSCRGSQ